MPGTADCFRGPEAADSGRIRLARSQARRKNRAGPAGWTWEDAWKSTGTPFTNAG